MKRSLLAIALSTFCLAGCGERPRVVAPLKPPAERMDCRVLESGRPSIPPEYAIDWSKVVTVDQARGEHDAYVRSVRTREGIAAGYIVQLEDRVFLCASDAEWLHDFFGRLPDPG